MNGRKKRKVNTHRERNLSRVLMIAAAFVLFGGLFMQISLRAQINQQSKDQAALTGEIKQLKANIENLDLCINNLYGKDELKERAFRLGMIEPREDQLRTIILYQPGGNTAAQTVANVGAGEVNG